MRNAITTCKQAVHWLFAKLGYKIILASRFGIDAIADLQTLAQAHPLRSIFDVGANEGQTLALFRQAFPYADIHCFEPSSDTFSRLKHATSDTANVMLHNIALGAENTSATLYRNRDSQTNSLLQNASSIEQFAPKAWIEPIGTSNVHVCRLDTFCNENHIQTIDLLKIDVQGYELQVLEGAAELLHTGRIAFIYLEVLFVPYYVDQAFFDQIYARLTAYRYKLVDIYTQTRAPDRSLMWCDALFMLDS